MTGEFPERLLAGHRDFLAGPYRAGQARLRELMHRGQRPHTFVITCCDSRFAPERLFACQPGEILVMRNVANLVPAYDGAHSCAATGAALEFAVNALGVENIIVLGHERCGGIAAALDHERTPLFATDTLGAWLAPLEEDAARLRAVAAYSDAQRQKALEHQSIRRSLRHLKDYPYVAARLGADTLAVHGAWFEISTGALWIMDTRGKEFVVSS